MKRFNVSYALKRQVQQTIQLHSNDYQPYQIIKMLNSGEIVINILPTEKQLIILKNGKSEVVGSLLEIGQQDNEQYSLTKVFKEHWASKLDFSNLI
jgi:hypothetical protein